MNDFLVARKRHPGWEVGQQDHTKRTTMLKMHRENLRRMKSYMEARCRPYQTSPNPDPFPQSAGFNALPASGREVCDSLSINALPTIVMFRGGEVVWNSTMTMPQWRKFVDDVDRIGEAAAKPVVDAEEEEEDPTESESSGQPPDGFVWGGNY